MQRLPNESEPAYEAFVMYVQAGVGRSAREVGRKLGKDWSLISRWCSKHRWLERAQAFDRRLQHVAQKAEEERIIASAGLWAKRMEQTREEAFEVAEELIAKARAMLKFPLSESTSADGKTVVKPGRWSFADAARMTDIAARLKQLSVGLPTERLEHLGRGAEASEEGPAVPVEEIQAAVFDQMRRELLFELRTHKVVEEPKVVEELKALTDATPGE